MNRSPIIALFLASACAALAQDVAPAPALTDEVKDFIVHRDRVFLVGPPLLIAGPRVSSPSWSTTGQFLMYEQDVAEPNLLNVQAAIQQQQPVKTERGLYIYSVATGKSTEVMRIPEDGVTNVDFQWIAQSDSALLVTDVFTQDSQSGRPVEDVTLYSVDASTASARTFSPWAGSGKPIDIQISPSPTLPYAFVSWKLRNDGFTPEGKPQSTYTSDLSLVGATGITNHITGPKGAEELTPVWSAEGTQAYLIARVKEGDTMKGKWYSLSLTNGDIKETTRPQNFYMGGGMAGGLIGVRAVSQVSQDGRESAPINSLWLETADPDNRNRLLLAGDASDGQVNKTLDGASYISQGSLFIRPIVEVPRKRFDDAVLAWAHAKTMNQAKQAAVGLLMFAADYNDVLPSQRENLTNLIGPYLKDSSDLDGFVYAYPGGPLNNIKSPATTKLGYIDAGDGRAVVYVDGHVEWVPKKG